MLAMIIIWSNVHFVWSYAYMIWTISTLLDIKKDCIVLYCLIDETLMSLHDLLLKPYILHTMHESCFMICVNQNYKVLYFSLTLFIISQLIVVHFV